MSEDTKDYYEAYNEGYENAVQEMYKTAFLISIDENAWRELKKILKKIVNLMEERTTL